MKLPNAGSIFFLLCLINLLNYVDRGIIPGSPIQFQSFITTCIMGIPDMSLAHENMYLGLLVSAFIAGYSIFSIPFGYWAIHCRPFLLISVGLSIWILAMLLCGLAEPTHSLGLLFAGRVLSGIGESSFQAIVPSFIEDFAPPSKRTSWLGIFYCGITLGTAAGYFYSALFATSALRWPWAYYTEGLAMIPLVLLCMFCIPAKFDLPSGHQHMEPISFVKELGGILQNRLFMIMSLGSSAYVFSISGLAAFGPSLLIGLGLFEESSAAMVFGSIIVVAGTIGTLLGGYLLDRSCTGADDELFRLGMATRQAVAFLVVGTSVLLMSWVCLDQDLNMVSMVLLAVALTFLFGCVPASIVALLLSVEKRKRGLALGINTMMSHLLGDVPSPIVLGMFKDFHAPQCRTIPNDEVLHPDCAHDRRGLKLTLLLPYVWLLWAILLAGVGVCLANKRKLPAALPQDTKQSQSGGTSKDDCWPVEVVMASSAILL
ncbi:hypothetical protein DYB25_008393 [Aphanomyces astaci]|uniref:Major facilitator superfamily (MFS) profile domain-containing protein n=1 Tax=Aphanomyces astaci TaxID=112090 RepID=A0A397DV29_APHAT|nr:hypothetical protein DYB25_008393 [Aphanomyces astaci]RHY52548.1 hypothetical protein DYB30_001658 [Aphanomyces astaci]RHY53459.1 hypothetical protein DYB34_004008 [Aphanomyces astaci]RHY67895.1 hypothetical protein DYB38_007082 [Aphanomyces astaci]RHZ03242.1 hypothetical protein DYB31_003528 [Aphanomyces astaci]